MRKIGFSAHEFVKIGLAASIFILLAKFLGPKTKVPAIAATTERL